MKNHENVKSMNIEQLAELIYSANDKICFENCKKVPAINTSVQLKTMLLLKIAKTVLKDGLKRRLIRDEI